MPKFSFSIVIPTYNRAAIVHSLVLDILPQLSSLDEVIVIDDCSTDDTMLIFCHLLITLDYISTSYKLILAVLPSHVIMVFH